MTIKKPNIIVKPNTSYDVLRNLIDVEGYRPIDSSRTSDDTLTFEHEPMFIDGSLLGVDVEISAGPRFKRNQSYRSRIGGKYGCIIYRKTYENLVKVTKEELAHLYIKNLISEIISNAVNVETGKTFGSSFVTTNNDDTMIYDYYDVFTLDKAKEGIEDIAKSVNDSNMDLGDNLEDVYALTLLEILRKGIRVKHVHVQNYCKLHKNDIMEVTLYVTFIY